VLDDRFVMRPIALALVWALAGASEPPARAAGIIEGRIILPAPPPAPAAKPRYPVAAGYTVGAADPPAAVVFLEGDFTRSRAERAEMAQRRYQFAPGLLPVEVGTVVSFPNLDDEYHSVFSYSKAKRFDLGRYHRNETPAALTFDRPGVVRLFCEIHDHMRGTILVLDTPYFQKTDADGRYRLADLPAGRWTLKAWIDEDVVLERQVELRDGATLQVDLPGG
jgi:plastocyanin